MPLKDELQANIKSYFSELWKETVGKDVPEIEDLKLGNEIRRIEGVVLYADMAGSTKLVDSLTDLFAAKIYKSYLVCAAKIIKDAGGTVTAYDGDRIMAVFFGPGKEDAAARAGLRLNYAVDKIINARLALVRPPTAYRVSHTVGIDVSSLAATRVGVRDDNDLTWVGRAANHAAKMTELEDGYVFMSADVYGRMSEILRYAATSGKESIWAPVPWPAMKRKLYRSNCLLLM